MYNNHMHSDAKKHHSPKMNAHVERFNRALQEQFVDYHEDQLFHDLAGFNRKLAAWLLDYNTVLPHP